MLWLGFHAVPISQNVIKYEEAGKFVENGKKSYIGRKKP
jgi:hypothetical protein